MKADVYAVVNDILVDAVRRNDTRVVLNNIGITVNLDDLPSWGQYQLARKKYDRSKMTRLFVRFALPSLYRKWGRELLKAQQGVYRDFLAELVARGVE